MISKNKIKLLISSTVIVLPAIAAIILNGYVDKKVAGAWHFGWILPVILLALQIFLHLVTFRENERVEQNEKIVNLTYWMIPAISVYVSALFMALSLGLENALCIILSVTFGAMFIVMGNYMPKAKQNRYFGMKIKWTLANEKNWNATHRMSGKLWVICGVTVLLGAFLPDMASVILLIAVSLVAVVAPILYSYLFYKKQIKDGAATKADYDKRVNSKIDKKTSILASVVGVVIVCMIIPLMFVGKLTFTFVDDGLKIGTTFGGGMTVEYDEIERVEYRPERVGGTRVSGFASSKLLYGWFKNDELGNYTRYTYTDSEAAVIIYTDDGIIVVADHDAQSTEAIYENISDRIMEGITND